MATTFSSPRAQPEVVRFLVSHESTYFSHYNPKSQLQIHVTYGVTAENVAISGLPIFILCIFITASSHIATYLLS